MLGIGLVVELLALYILSRRVTQGLFTFFLLLFRSRSVALSLVLVLEFPGTAVHELSHLFTAGILGVRAGKLTLTPEIESEHVHSGSVSIEHTDPFRRYAIALAPVVWGTLILCAIAYLLPSYWPDWGNLGNMGYWGTPQPYIFLLLPYCMFAVSNTMFSSPEDLKGFIPYIITIGIFVGLLYYLGVRFVLTGVVLETATRVLVTLVKSLGVVVGVNIGILIILQLMTRMMMKIRRI